MPKRVWILRRLAYFAAVLAAIYLTLCAVGGVVVLEGALHPQRLTVALQETSEDTASRLAPGGLEDAQSAGADGAKLVGWYAKPEPWNGSSVILLHGVGDNREGVAGYANVFLRSGYAVLLPDSRAQGESGGPIATYGLLESEDVRHWSDWLVRRNHSGERTAPAGCMYLFGESMGAAIALQAAATVPGVCAVVAEAPFSSFREIAYERIAQGLGSSVHFSHIAAWPMVNFAFFYARVRYGLDFNQASPERKLALSHVPALLIAGLADRNIPARHSIQIAKFADSSSQLWLVEGAGHTEAASANPAVFERRVVGWFSDHSQKAH